MIVKEKMCTNKRDQIAAGKTVLGIEFGSTRIKGVLLNGEQEVLAAGSVSWENRLEDGVWTYHLEEVWAGLQACYLEIKNKVQEAYGLELETIGAMGISAMMHGYLVFDQKDRLLVPFRTWRNTMTELAAAELTELFAYPIPQRWSIAHLYQAMLNGEEHGKDIRYMTTLAGYVHWKLTGERVLGIDDASGMFPIEGGTGDYNGEMLGKMDGKIAKLLQKPHWHIKDILPKVLPAGVQAGRLTEEGAGLLDPEGTLKSGVPLCPPAGDAGTGMVATNSVRPRTGNVSAGTSVFSMLVLEKALDKVYPEIDLVATPEGNSVAMVHANNCTGDLDAWISLFGEFGQLFHMEISREELYAGLYCRALEGDADCGGLLAYNYLSGEHITCMEEGRPLFIRGKNSRFTLANFMRTHLCTALGAIKQGNDLLLKEEGVKAEMIRAQGGFFKTGGVGQKILATALNTTVSVLETVGEGGAWGIAVLAAYMLWCRKQETLSDFLDHQVFAQVQSICVEPDPAEVEGFDIFMKRYRAGLGIERAAVEALE